MQEGQQQIPMVMIQVPVPQGTERFVVVAQCAADPNGRRMTATLPSDGFSSPLEVAHALGGAEQGQLDQALALAAPAQRVNAPRVLVPVGAIPNGQLRG